MTPVPDAASCITLNSTFDPEASALVRPDPIPGSELVLVLVLALAFCDEDVDVDERNKTAGTGSCGSSIASSRSRRELGESRRTES
ncbi:hypothetical protein N7505_008184 [Penicillium chrysogenum]|jgi:hypothetical protein|uniref:Uncharacterized protein n=1 Tax=Penicillium chrysogenum TaxID=5076 RepID=A0ABQ8WD44_PENCH|nr:hypothetical protein N7505_008184 [Penicillium chrysogenum]